MIVKTGRKYIVNTGIKNLFDDSLIRVKGCNLNSYEPSAAGDDDGKYFMNTATEKVLTKFTEGVNYSKIYFDVDLRSAEVVEKLEKIFNESTVIDEKVDLLEGLSDVKMYGKRTKTEEDGRVTYGDYKIYKTNGTTDTLIWREGKSSSESEIDFSIKPGSDISSELFSSAAIFLPSTIYKYDDSKFIKEEPKEEPTGTERIKMVVGKSKTGHEMVSEGDEISFIDGQTESQYVVLYDISEDNLEYTLIATFSANSTPSSINTMALLYKEESGSYKLFSRVVFPEYTLSSSQTMTIEYHLYF